MMDYFKIQDIFLSRMRKDYESGLITNPIFKPYFQWKFYGYPLQTLTKEICYNILDETEIELEDIDCRYPNAASQMCNTSTLEDVWLPYRGYGEDAYLYSYLQAIDSEVTNIILMTSNYF